MGDCSTNCNPCGPSYDAINQLAVQTKSYARQALSAVTTVEEFQSLYLGAKATAPTTDNEGNPLQVGALYFNTTDGEMYVWAGSAWELFGQAGYYLGAKASDPTTDNEGNPLVAGLLYFNTTSNVMRVYNGTFWQNVAFDESTPFLATGTTEPRNLVTRMADVVNVKDFGAVGDGVADDTAAIIAAINYAQKNATDLNVYRPTVFFPAGDYAVTTITLNSYRGLNFVGEQTIDATRQRTRLKYIGANGTDALLKIISCQHLNFTGFLFYINNRESINSLILFQSNSTSSVSPLSRLSNNWITFRDCAFFIDIAISNKPQQNIWAKNCSTVTFDRCRIMSGALTSIRIGADSDVDPSNGLPTLADGIATITRISDCYITGDITREKSYMLEIRGTQFGIVDTLNTSIGGTGPRRTSRINTSGNQIVYAEKICGNVWDNTETDNFVGTLILSGNNSSSSIEVSSNQLAGQRTLVEVQNGTAIVTGNRGIPVIGAPDFTNRFLRASSSAKSVYINGNNEEDFCSNNTSGSRPAVILSDARTINKYPILINGNLPSNVTLPSAGTFLSLISTSHKFTGGYVRISYSVSILHKDSTNKTYNAQVRLNGTEIKDTMRRISIATLDTFDIISWSGIVYIAQEDSSLNIDLAAMQSEAGTLGIINGNASASVGGTTTLTIELLNT